mgnify:CR=1 FL=1
MNADDMEDMRLNHTWKSKAEQEEGSPVPVFGCAVLILAGLIALMAVATICTFLVWLMSRMFREI